MSFTVRPVHMCDKQVSFSVWCVFKIESLKEAAVDISIKHLKCVTENYKVIIVNRNVVAVCLELITFKNSNLRLNCISKSDCYCSMCKSVFRLPHFIKYNGHFFTLKMMLKYSLCTINGRLLRKGLRWLS